MSQRESITTQCAAQRPVVFVGCAVDLRLSPVSPEVCSFGARAVEECHGGLGFGETQGLVTDRGGWSGVATTEARNFPQLDVGAVRQAIAQASAGLFASG